MTPLTIIFTGRSGCGKGTQAELLDQFLKENTPEIPVIHLETGKLFREFIQGENYTHELSKKIYEHGGLQPEFLTIHLWSDFFVTNMQKNSHLIIDGTPRKLNESETIDSALRFYGRDKVNVVEINVSRQVSEERMLERKRSDDNKRDIEARLDWYDKEVVPAVDFFKNKSLYDFHEIDGERSIDDIHSDIVKTLGLK